MPIREILNAEVAKQFASDNWKIRRRGLRIGILSLWANAEFVLIYSLYHESNIGVQIFFTLIGAIMSVFMIYVFGATYDDHSKRRWAASCAQSEDSSGDDEDGEKSDDLLLPTPGDKTKKDTE